MALPKMSRTVNILFIFGSIFLQGCGDNILSPEHRSTFLAQGRVAAPASTNSWGDGPEDVVPVAHALESWKARRYRLTVRQERDFTCGAASLATLVNFYYGRNYTEQQILELVLGRYTKEERKKKSQTGLSFNDLSFAASKLGFQSLGATMGLSGLRQLKGPVIVHLDRKIIQHFSVFRGFAGDRVFLSDPILGDTRYSIDRFLKEFTGAVFAVWVDGEELPHNHRLLVQKNFEPPEYGIVSQTLVRRPPPSPNKPF